MQLVFMTAYQMLITCAQLKKDETVLIYGGSSGIGAAAIQIAKYKGANVITTVGSDSKKQFAKNMGADFVVLHNVQNYKPDFHSKHNYLSIRYLAFQ